MQFDAATIERMVRQVLNQIQPTASAPAQVPNVVPNPAKLLSVPTAAVSAQNELPRSVPLPRTVILDRVVTADLLKEQIKPGSQLVIAAKSIITPSGQDYLRSNRIPWERAVVGSESQETATTASWRILLSSVNERVKRIVEVICAQRLNVKREVTGTAAEAASSVITAISRGEIPGVIVVTAAPHVVACRVNRNRFIRAAVVGDLKSWEAARTTLHPNVVCLDANDRSFMELQNLLNRIVSGPAPEPPADWNE